MHYDPLTLELGPFLWFGAAPGEPLPPLGQKVGRHTKGNSDGVKAERSSVRLIPRSQFLRLDTIGELADRLFGLVQGSGPAAREAQIKLLREHLQARRAAASADRLEEVRAGDFTAFPEDLAWDTSVEAAHLIEGYEL